LNNHSFNRLSAELREGDPLCRYVTLERSSIELTLAQRAENTAASDCLRALATNPCRIAARMECRRETTPAVPGSRFAFDQRMPLTVSQVAIRRYRHSVRYEYAANLQELLTRTANALTEDARHERERGHTKIAETIENMSESLPMVVDCLNALLSQFLIRECMASEAKGRTSRGGL